VSPTLAWFDRHEAKQATVHPGPLLLIPERREVMGWMAADGM
jgi:hypothetical protein